MILNNESLFGNDLLFDEGKKRFTQFQLPGADMKLWEQFFSRQASDRYFNTFLQSPWAQHRRKMYDKIVADPRLTAWYGRNGTNEWTPELLEVKAMIEGQCGISFNSVLLNYYRDGNDSVAWHSDTLPADGVHHAIASVTFGETRHFRVRHKTDSSFNMIEIPLTHGSFLLMGETMQSHYEHHVPKTKRLCGPRINLTFRITN